MSSGKSIYIDFQKEERNLPFEFQKLNYVNAIQSFDTYYEASFPVPADCAGRLSVYVKEYQVVVYLEETEGADDKGINGRSIRFFRSFAIPPDVDEKMIAASVRTGLLTIRMFKHIHQLHIQIETDKVNIFNRLKNYLIEGLKS